MNTDSNASRPVFGDRLRQMTPRQRQGTVALVVAFLVTVVIIVTFASGSSSPRGLLPLATAPGAGGIVDATQPTSDGKLWTLTNTYAAANVQLVDVYGTKPLRIIPTSLAATSVAIGGGGPLAVGQGTTKSGAISFYSPSTGHLLGTTPVSGPVISMTTSGVYYYALVKNQSSEAIATIQPQTRAVLQILPAPKDTISIAAASNGSTIYAAQSNGNVAEIDTSSGKVYGNFGSFPNVHAMCINPSNTFLYILKGLLSNNNVAVVNLTTQSQVDVLPAPADTVSVGINALGTQIYDVVGTQAYGNVQLYNLPDAAK